MLEAVGLWKTDGVEPSRRSGRIEIKGDRRARRMSTIA
jgi:hypothetical protein